jgi:hypothetical protein
MNSHAFNLKRTLSETSLRTFGDLEHCVVPLGSVADGVGVPAALVLGFRGVNPRAPNRRFSRCSQGICSRRRRSRKLAAGDTTREVWVAPTTRCSYERRVSIAGPGALL